MAGKKKQEIQLQREIETQEEWEECLAIEGIWVVDVYQEWCGPCQALVGNFRRLRNELGDPLLNYAIAKADTIDALEKYRGRCEPTFLFYAGGILVSFVHGANAPKIQRTITEQLAQEHKVLEGQSERKEVKDTVMTRAAEKEIAQKEKEEMERELEDGYSPPSCGSGGSSHDVIDEHGEPKGITVAIIKPDVVAAGKADEIIQQIKDQGIEIIAEEEKELTEEEATELYKDLEDESYFNDLVKFVTSGPCRVLVLTKGEAGETVLKDWREMIGPTNVEKAKEEAPDSLRAKYGESGYINALHGSSSSEAAARELAFFFPQMAMPTYKKKKENIQRTLAIIRPEAFSAKKDEILEKISEAGFKIAFHKEIDLTKEQAAEFYKEHEGQSYFDQLVENMTSGPVLALCLAGDEAITGWRDMLGPANVDDAVETAPESLRAQFTGPSGLNQFHGSDSEEKAKKELDFFFPMEETVAVIKPSAMGTKDAIIDRIHEAGFRIAARKETTITQDIAEMLYPQQADKEYYDDLVQSMTSGPTMFMVLSREDAVDSWRQEIGDTNPEEAKEHNPQSIRAQFGQDILNNAVHGSSNREQAKKEMKAVFGDLQFNEDGTIKGQEPELEEASEAFKVDRTSPIADTAPEYREDRGMAGFQKTDKDSKQRIDRGDTTADETTADTTQDVTADTTTQEATADQTEADETKGDTTVADTTQGEETTAEETEAETTQGDTTLEETTQEPTIDETQVDETQADETQADETQGDTTAGDITQEATSEEKTEGEATSGEPETTVGDTTTEEKPSEETPAVKEENEKEEVKGEAKGEEKPEEESKEETKQEEPKEESSGQDNDTQAKGQQNPSSGEGEESKTVVGETNNEEGSNSNQPASDAAEQDGPQGGEDKKEESRTAVAVDETNDDNNNGRQEQNDSAQNADTSETDTKTEPEVGSKETTDEEDGKQTMVDGDGTLGDASQEIKGNETKSGDETTANATTDQATTES